jgi:hypothetical protein
MIRPALIKDKLIGCPDWHSWYSASLSREPKKTAPAATMVALRLFGDFGRRHYKFIVVVDRDEERRLKDWRAARTCVTPLVS